MNLDVDVAKLPEAPEEALDVSLAAVVAKVPHEKPAVISDMEPVDSKPVYRGMAAAAANAVAIQQQLANCTAAEQINTEEAAPAAALCNYLGSPSHRS